MERAYLDPKQPLEYEPAAERNVDRISDACLDVNGKSRQIVIGRGGGAWWMIWMGVACLSFCLLAPLFAADTVEAYYSTLVVGLITSLGFGISLIVWPIYVWRTRHPIRFCRRDRKVYCHWGGQTYTADWDRIRAYPKIQPGATGTGAPILDPQINIEFDTGASTPLTIFLLASDGPADGFDAAALTLWEYIRRYMEEGPEHIPRPSLGVYAPLRPDEIVQAHSPFPMFQGSFGLGLFELITFPFMVIFFLLWTPTDWLYYHLERRLKPAPYPPDLQEASAGETRVFYEAPWPMKPGLGDRTQSPAA